MTNESTVHGTPFKHVMRPRRYPRVYSMLKAYGHSPHKALDITIDAYRGNPTALKWVRWVRKVMSRKS